MIRVRFVIFDMIHMKTQTRWTTSHTPMDRRMSIYTYAIYRIFGTSRVYVDTYVDTYTIYVTHTAYTMHMQMYDTLSYFIKEKSVLHVS